MKPIYNRVFLGHLGEIPETSERFRSFIGRTVETPLRDIPDGERYLNLVHTPRYIEACQNACKNSWKFDSVPTTPESYEAARYAVGASILAADTGGFALVRPPGHHATPDLQDEKIGNGYCLFNNMAIATRYLANKGKRVLVLDFDLHHGNGTEEALKGIENIVFVSTRQAGNVWPFTSQEDSENCHNVCYPQGTGDEAYLGRLSEKLDLIIQDFHPDVIGLSAGFDGSKKDLDFVQPEYPNPITKYTKGFNLTKESYVGIKQMVGSFPNFAVLEGGYNPESINEGLEVFLK